jgi:hypothetical protein
MELEPGEVEAYLRAMDKELGDGGVAVRIFADRPERRVLVVAYRKGGKSWCHGWSPPEEISDAAISIRDAAREQGGATFRFALGGLPPIEMRTTDVVALCDRIIVVLRKHLAQRIPN